ncbi:Uncharacterized conserved protein YciI, contains a putative active-site phosphohistidine [Amycolatopsis sacchari]|nr:Uncharacterized conserved protein YciI, contains a putative active-site phosphohistidine [Amycolatopsis sacchari]
MTDVIDQSRIETAGMPRRSYRQFMYVVLLTFTAPMEEVDYALPDHAKWLEKHFQAGEFLAAGRCNPREGGVILTRPMSRAKLEAILCLDPFALQHLATYEIVEFAATRTAPELSALNEAVLA